MTAPGSTDTAPHGKLKAQIENDFGSVESMKEKFNAAASSRFGSGWAWLGVKADGSLGITSTPNQGIQILYMFNFVFSDIIILCRQSFDA